jgi:hypothetical protein
MKNGTKIKLIIVKFGESLHGNGIFGLSSFQPTKFGCIFNENYYFGISLINVTNSCFATAHVVPSPSA